LRTGQICIAGSVKLLAAGRANPFAGAGDVLTAAQQGNDLSVMM